MMWNLNDIIRETQGTLLQGKKDCKVSNISTDSRTMRPGSLFIALRGKSFDGHHFVPNAIAKKASAVIVDKNKISAPPNVSVIYVKDTLKALRDIATFHRTQFQIPVIAITASAGKTTTKEMISEVLSKKYRVLKNIGTENNQIGVSKTLLKLKSFHDIAIFELGTNRGGEIRQLGQMVKPAITIFLNVGESHLKYLKTLAGVFKEKTSLISTMPQKGLVIFNADDEKLQKLRNQRMLHKKLSFSIFRPSLFQVKHVQNVPCRKIHFNVNHQSFMLSASSVSYVYNALAAIICGQLFNVPHRKVCQVLKDFSGVKARQHIYQKRGVWVIDDTYNANPLSVRSALNVLKNFPDVKRRIFVFGDMKELGKQALLAHQKLSQDIINAGVDFLFTLGPLSKQCGLKLKSVGSSVGVRSFSSLDDAAQAIKSFLSKDDAVLFKGSRSMSIDDILRNVFNSKR